MFVQTDPYDVLSNEFRALHKEAYRRHPKRKFRDTVKVENAAVTKEIISMADPEERDTVEHLVDQWSHYLKKANKSGNMSDAVLSYGIASDYGEAIKQHLPRR